jgi:hypothetical protein
MRRLGLLAPTMLALLVGACASPGPPGALKPQDAASTATASPSSGSPSAKAKATTSSGEGSGSTSTPAAARSTGPSPVVLPWTPSPNVPVDATVSPVCVKRGGLIKLEVQTRPSAGVAYQAVYADNGGGAPKPYGKGYGGNDKGTSTPTGVFTSAWTVSLNAPVGPARVDVIVGWNNAWGYDGPTFTVAGPDGRC